MMNLSRWISDEDDINNKETGKDCIAYHTHTHKKGYENSEERQLCIDDRSL